MAVLTPEQETVGAILYGIDGGARDVALGTPEILVNMTYYHVGLEKLRTLGTMLWYGDTVGLMGRSTRVKMDVNKLVSLWADVLVDLSTAHDHEKRSLADQQSDELLGPLLTAPIKQVRSFASKLAVRLRDDERVPFLVWSTFERLIAPLIMRGPEGKTVELKTALATEIAELVEHDLDRSELIASMAAALQWRSPEKLESIKSGLKRGARPRLKGGESCLFLSVDGQTVVL